MSSIISFGGLFTVRPPHTKIIIFHNEPPFHSCIYYSAIGDEYQKFKLIISSSTSDLSFWFKNIILRHCDCFYCQVRSMCLRYEVAPIPQTDHLSGSFLRFALLWTGMESSSLVRSPSCFSMADSRCSGKLRDGWRVNLKSTIRRSCAFCFAPITSLHTSS